VSAGGAAGDSITLGTHQIGDIIVIAAFEQTSLLPDLGAGFTNITDVLTGAGQRVGYLIATSASETSGVWTGAGLIQFQIYRSLTGDLGIGSTPATNSALSATMNYPATALDNGDSWVAAFGGNSRNDVNLTPPTGMILRSQADIGGGSGQDSRGFDTDGAVASWNSQDVAQVGLGTWITSVIEITETAPSVGISLTVTEVLNSFSDTSNINIDYNVSATITETLNSFGDSSTVSVIGGGEVTLSITETLSTFSDSSVINVSANVDLLVTEVLNSFLDGSNVTIAKDITLQVTEIFNSFADNSSLRLPANWTDKPKVATSYTIQTPTSTIWTDKG
jgi:hypothetical protein